MNRQNEFEKELEQEIYGLRLLVLLECESECQDGRHFHQVTLNSKAFKAVSDAVFRPTTPKDEEGFQQGLVDLSEDTLAAEPFENMRDIYE